MKPSKLREASLGVSRLGFIPLIFFDETTFEKLNPKRLKELPPF